MGEAEKSLLPTGKLDFELLAELLAGLRRDDPAVVEGPGIGRDVAVLDIGANVLLVAKSDPITFATDAIGYYAVTVNSNDIACCGGRPRFMLATLLLPEGRTDHSLVENIFRQLREACDSIGVTLVGGHTEVTYGLDRPIVCGAMLGTVSRDQLVTPDRAAPGDVLIMTKAAAIEGTAILARELPVKLKEAGVSDERLQRAAQLLFDPGISVLRDAQVATSAGRVHAMHDPTEGGIASGIWELAAASGRRIVVDVQAIPVLPECRLFCRLLGIDPLGLIASGSLLIAAPPDSAQAIIHALEREGIGAAAIGRIEEGPPEAVAEMDGRTQPLPRYDQDELTKVL